MGVARDDLLLLVRALKRGFVDLRAARKALDRQVSRPISLLEALHLPAAEAEALRGDAAAPDSVKDRPVLEGLREALLEGEHLTPGEWEKFVASLARPTARHAWPGIEVPREFEGYTVQWELARRERGVVFRAKDPEGRDVALKVFRTDVPGADKLPQIEGHGYAAAPLEEGETLENRKLSVRRGAQAIEKAARALGGKAHGQLTPARILVRKDDTVALLGFPGGIPPSPRTLAYAGPSDVHALGAILYEILVGSPPAGETSPAARLKVDPDLDRVVACALTGGYASPAEFADDLARYLKGEPVTGRKAAAQAASRRSPWLWAAAAAAVPVAAAAIYFLFFRPGDPPPKDPATAGAPERPPAPPVPPEAPPAPPRPAPPKDKPPARVELPPLTRDDEDRLWKECVEAVGKGDSTRVIALANEAIARGSKREWPAYHLAVVYADQDQLDKALEYVTRALQAAPENREYLSLRAQTYAFRGEARKALADFKGIYGTRAELINKEIRRLTQQLAVDPRDARGHLLRAVFFFLKRHYETAAADFGRAIELGQRRALAWRALCGLESGDRAAAEQDAKAYLAEFPADFATEEVKALLRELGRN